MSVEKWWNEMCGWGKREKPREKPTQTPFRPPRNPHGGTETRTQDPSGCLVILYIGIWVQAWVGMSPTLGDGK